MEERLTKDMKQRLESAANAVNGLRYCEWCVIRNIIEQEFSSKRAKVLLDDPELADKLQKHPDTTLLQHKSNYETI